MNNKKLTLKYIIKNNINPITGWKADKVKEDYNEDNNTNN